MKKLILTLAAALLLPLPSQGGEIIPGSVPGTLNYQGRLERDNAPVTGPVHLYFRVYNSATATNTGGGACGGVSQPCLWESPEITVQATQGVFSADMTPPITVLARGQQLYLEVQVESDVLSPREPISSVAYAMVAKRLEDGADVTVSTISAYYTVKMATATGAYMTVGTGDQSSGARLTVDGWLKLTSGGIIFPDNSSMNIASIASAGNISNYDHAYIMSDNDSSGGGDIILRKPTLDFLRVTNSGKVGIGSAFTADAGANAPGGAAAGPLLDIDGALYLGDEGLYDRDDGEVNVKEDLIVEGGRVTGMNSEYISMGETNNTIALVSGGSTRLRVYSNGYVGVGLLTPTANLHVAGDILSNAGVRGGNVSVGTYAGDWTALANEVRADAGTHLLLQQTNSYNVGIGTNTPREKLHVRGSVLADYGVAAATAAFSGNVRVDGDFDANSSQGNMVYLSTTVVYGTLQVTGGIGSQAGIPVYLNSTQTLTGQNTFLNQVVVSSDIVTVNRIGAGVDDFDFAGAKYLQVGDNKPEFANDDATAYLVGGSAADAKLRFYRGASESARFETQSGQNLGLVLNGQTKTLTDATYHRIQNSVVWISTGYNTTPSIYVSSALGNVGMGTSVMDPNWKLTVAGNIRLDGSGSSLIFADGTYLDSAGSIGSATNVSANGDAVVQSNADLSGGGNVILRAGSLDGLVLNTGGNIGIGTLNPVSKLNLRGGDLVLGTPYNPYSGDSVEDLIVGGNIAFDGELVQRSNLQVLLSGLMVANDVYLSTTASANTGIGTDVPAAKLDVEGDAQFGSGTTKSTFTSTGELQLASASPLKVRYGGTGATTYTDGGMLFGNGTSPVGATAVLTNGQLLIGDNDQEPSLATLTPTANQVNVTNGAGTITLSLPQDIHTAAKPLFASITAGSATLTTALTVANGGTGQSGYTTGDMLYASGASALSKLADVAVGNALISGGVGTAPSYGKIGLTTHISGTLAVGNGGTGATSLTGVLEGNGTGAVTARTGTANTIVMWGTGGDNITDSVMTVESSTINVNSHRIKNLATPSSSQDAATKGYVDSATGSSGPAWSKYGNTVVGGNYMGSDNNADVIFKRNNTEIMKLQSTGLDVTGNITISGNVDGYDISASGPNWDTAYTHSGTNTGAVHGATSANTASMIVRRDGSGNFTAGTITATTFSGALSGNASTVTNGVYTSGSYSNPSWITALAGSKITGDISGNAGTVTNGVYTTGSYANPGWITSLAGSKITGNISGNAGTATALAANGSNCTAGNYPLGVDASGAAESCTSLGTASAGKAVCWKTATTLGYCSDQPNATGDCTCN